MIALYALACHAAGDFPLQTDRMATQKFDSRRVRAEHCAVYTLAFLPFIVATGWSVGQAGAFSTVLFATHFVIDSRRWSDAVPIWYDQALHVIALAVAVAVADGVVA